MIMRATQREEDVEAGDEEGGGVEVGEVVL